MLSLSKTQGRRRRQAAGRSVAHGPGRPRSVGAALIEVLVSMLLSAVALLALASVNAAALRLGKLSQHRVGATLLALDLAERMRANPPGAGQGHYEFSAGWASQGTVPTPTAQCQKAGSLCTSAAMAALDLAQWRWHVRQLLPQGSVHVRNQLGRAAGQAMDYLDIWIAWQEPQAAPGAGSGPDSEFPAAAGECPDALGTALDASVRCSHLRVHL